MAMPPIATKTSQYGYPYGTKLVYTDNDGTLVQIELDEAVKRQRAAASKLGMHYRDNDDALHDFITVNWCKVKLP
jgi:hypothetical protein